MTLSITGNKDSESGITVTGKFAQGVIQKLIFESFQNLESGAYTEGTYSVSGSCGSSTSYYNLFYHGIFNGNTNLSQVIIKEGLVIPAYTFSNCGGVGNKVISSNGAEYNKEVYWPINKAKQTSKPQPVTPTSSITVQNSNISNKEEDDNTINVSYGLFGFMLLIVVGFVVFLIKKVVKH